MKTHLLILVAALTLSGCTAVKALYKDNAQMIAILAPGVAAPACAAAVSGLRPHEALPACTALTSCARAICATPQGQ